MDIIFCRNVLMYFAPECAKKVIQNLYHSIVDGGWMIVSPSEVSHVLFSQFMTVNLLEVIRRLRTTAKELVQTVKLMSEVKVVRRWPRPKTKHMGSSVPKLEFEKVPAEIKIVAIGASTGGAIVLQTIFSGLPKDFSVPVLIVQHIASGFVHGFEEWLAQSSDFPVHVATRAEPILPGYAYCS